MITYKEFINPNEIDNLLNLSNEALNSFRYFKTRSTTMVLCHKYNVICYYDSIPCAYGHLDYDENSKLWLGILVADQYQNKGLGKRIMEMLLKAFYKLNEKKLYLSVDKDNIKAINLYKKFGFDLLEKKENVLYYILQKD